RLADDAGIERLAARRRPVEQLARAVDPRPLLVAGDEQADRAAEITPAPGDEARRRRGEAGDRALHVGGAAAVQRVATHGPAEGITGPGLAVARRHHVHMPGEAEIAARIAEPRIEVQHRLGARLAELLEMA